MCSGKSNLTELNEFRIYSALVASGFLFSELWCAKCYSKRSSSSSSTSAQLQLHSRHVDVRDIHKSFHIIFAFFPPFLKQLFCRRICLCVCVFVAFILNAIRCLNCVINLKCVSVNFSSRKYVRFDCEMEGAIRNEYHFTC